MMKLDVNTQQLYALIGQLTVENMALKAQLADFLNRPDPAARVAKPQTASNNSKAAPNADAAKPAS